MNPNKILLYSLIAKPRTMTLFDYENNLYKIAHLRKENFSLIEEFNFNYSKNIFDTIIEYGLIKVFELGFSISEIDRVLHTLFRNDKFKLTQSNKEKLMKDCDEVADWIRKNISTTAKNEFLTHEFYHKLNYLYSIVKRQETED